MQEHGANPRRAAILSGSKAHPLNFDVVYMKKLDVDLLDWWLAQDLPREINFPTFTMSVTDQFTFYRSGWGFPQSVLPKNKFLMFQLDIDHITVTFFGLAVAYGNTSLMRQLWENGWVDSPNEAINGYPPLNLAAAAGHISMMRLLFEMGAEQYISARDPYKRTALSCAAESGSLAAITLLIEHGAITDLHRVDAMGRTPLALAVEAGCQVNVLEYFFSIGAGFSLTVADNEEVLPIQYALDKMRADLVCCLLANAAGVGLNFEEDQWHTLLTLFQEEMQSVDGALPCLFLSNVPEELLIEFGYPAATELASFERFLVGHKNSSLLFSMQRKRQFLEMMTASGSALRARELFMPSLKSLCIRKMASHAIQQRDEREREQTSISATVTRWFRSIFAAKKIHTSERDLRNVYLLFASHFAIEGRQGVLSDLVPIIWSSLSHNMLAEGIYFHIEPLEQSGARAGAAAADAAIVLADGVTHDGDEELMEFELQEFVPN